uniref:Uncharacterized protein n=1 Tax=Chromera velia CCMP2878 TaxID=1169474 RepID=A0A0G4FVQ0_9ALVE|mmetsp:Transcript_10176/g.19729  ORF Transcript_10176/g.19729 Transcript_10176/m.19729 type:complete len:297 (-) Transcript_10176:208-1098(-)|eukprot:Cvel_19002.t1-p1 / transcript=Cvel_19002.t1 / gene=Cvel_19002 / organism=Chromera_velia_CCMP2878 / gene_product=Histone-lysine N-methyltransferase EHMT1, putative / transcript_product=Histone-lysine N-methyltransferase EHMT1, putative / location=Cvel_scaffold1608:22239-25036(+) / protein_length=296 / sequence_SO=supercontig / SO=protein_coding / is_pseudo=false
MMYTYLLLLAGQAAAFSGFRNSFLSRQDNRLVPSFRQTQSDVFPFSVLAQQVAEGKTSVRIDTVRYDKAEGEEEVKEANFTSRVVVDEAADEPLSPEEQFVKDATDGDFQAVKAHLDAGRNPNRCRDQDGRSPLHGAAESNHETIVNVLLDNDANPDIQSWSGNTPLHSACVRGHISLVKTLVNGGADVNLPSATGAWTALQKACYAGKQEVVEYLIKKRADPNAMNDDGWTAMAIATIEGYVEIMRAVSAAGGMIQKKDLFTEQKEIIDEMREELRKKELESRDANEQGFELKVQ